MTTETKTEKVYAKLDKDIQATIVKGAELTASASALFTKAAHMFYESLLVKKVPHNEMDAVVKQARNLYDEFFPTANHRQVFGNRIYLLMGGKTKLEYTDRKGNVHKTDAASAAAVAEDRAKAATKALRDKLGKGNAPGQGAPRAPQTPAAPVVQVFSLIEFKTLLAGLFGNSGAPHKTINDCLAEYKMVAVSADDYERFVQWEEANCKKAS